jgi:glucose-6-phosphate isomerase
LKNTVIIGIGGSYLGPEFISEAFRHDKDCSAASQGRQVKFLANVDPIDVQRAMEGLDISETLFVINSKTFTTAETMLNARTIKKMIIKHFKDTDPSAKDEDVVGAHMSAVSTNLPATGAFGIKDERVFGFWDWVGGRYSVSSAVGILPLSLQYSFANANEFLRGLESVDDHFHNETDVLKNIPVLMGLIGFYNTNISNFTTRAILPYSQALLKLAPHIQQLDMESNGKRVTLNGEVLQEQCGPVNFGEPGTNGQHSFYQLMH